MSAVDVRLDRSMERIEAELLTDGGNAAVVRTPGRRFPGVVVPGDSLHILRGDVAEVAEACERGDLDEARESAGLLLAHLDALPVRYQRWTNTRFRGRTELAGALSLGSMGAAMARTQLTRGGAASDLEVLLILCPKERQWVINSLRDLRFYDFPRPDPT
ncbi:DUF6959 family protein [Streptomyces sp. NPDC058066]|uniref:DUF6959 family protein n=1 Tax=Streptomyces sp. NPDC058066 TaxID=3346323 RepID=UPI0036EEB040